MNLLYFAPAVLGMVVGSFLNVCIYRVPAHQSIVRPASRCPSCLSSIPWYQNIPVFSFLALRGRCGACGASISWRYPAVEILTGALFTLIVYRFGMQGFVPLLWLFAALLVVIAFIDIDHQIIPDVISLPGILLGFLSSFIIPWMTWVDSLLGLLLGGGSLYLVALVYQLLAKKEGMGGGDIKLLAMIGAFLGWKAVLPVIFFSSVFGTVVGLPLVLVKKADGKLAIPFGPFLSIGALVYLLWGPPLVRWYFAFFQQG